MSYNNLKNYFVDSYKLNKPCTDCKKIYNPWQMDFDHVRGKKHQNIAMMKEYRKERILEEIAKCELVCANCHRQRTWLRVHWPEKLLREDK